jgi:hypothetical protein
VKSIYFVELEQRKNFFLIGLVPNCSPIFDFKLMVALGSSELSIKNFSLRLLRFFLGAFVEYTVHKVIKLYGRIIKLSLPTYIEGCG